MIDPADYDLVVRVSAWELDEWAWLCDHLEDWLNHADDDTRRNYKDQTPIWGPKLDDVTWQLASMSSRMRRLASGLVEDPLA